MPPAPTDAFADLPPDAPQPVTDHVQVAPGVQIAVDRWPRARGERPVLFLHATGFTRGVWRAHARRLLDDCQPFAADLRGHGGSSRPEPPYDWALLVDDIATLVESRGWRDLVLVGHSVGGSTCVEVAHRLPDRVSAVVLTEPPLGPPRPRPNGGDGKSDLVGRTERRRAHWPNRAEADIYLRSRAPYDAWADEVWAGFVETGLTADHDPPGESGRGGEVPEVSAVTLSCPPWAEVSVFKEAPGSRAWETLPELRQPVWVLRATGAVGMPSTCAPETAQRLRHPHEVVVEGSGHFLPLEQPDVVVRLVRDALAATGSPPA